MKNKKEKIVAILLVVGLIVVTGSISYAAFRFSGLGSKVNTITTGSITMSYTESSNVLSMSGALPTTDATGTKRLNPGEYFDFTVSSSMSASTNINYEVAVEELDGNTMSGEFIKFYLTKVDAEGNEEEVMAPSTYNVESSANTYTGRPANMMSLYTSSMDASETNTYRLRMYVSEEYNPQGDGGNLTYQARVNVYGLAGDEINSVLVYKAEEGNYTIGSYYVNSGSIVSNAIRGYTDQIKVEEGAKYYFSLSEGHTTLNSPVICTFDADGNYVKGYKYAELSSLAGSGIISEYEHEYAYITIPTEVKYIALNAIYSYAYTGLQFDSEEIYVYKNSLPKDVLHTYQSNITGTNNLTGKSMIVFGDSIAHGQLTKEESFVTYIAEGNSMSFVKKGLSGAKAAAILNTFTSTDTTSYDYVIVEGFVNDINSTETTLGTLTEEGTTEFDTTTFIGSLENAIYKYKESGNTAKLGFVLTKELPRKSAIQREYWDAAISVFEKYDVAYLDLFNDDYTLSADKIHPLFEGQLEMAEVIESWMNTL